MDARRQAGAGVGVRNLFDDLRLRRIGVDRPGDLPQSYARRHGEGELGDHFPRVPGDERRPEDLVRSFLNVNLQKALFLAVEDSPVHVRKLQGEGLHGDAPFDGVILIQPYVGDLRVGVGAPRDGQRASPRSSEACLSA